MTRSTGCEFCCHAMQVRDVRVQLFATGGRSLPHARLLVSCRVQHMTVALKHMTAAAYPSTAQPDPRSCSWSLTFPAVSACRRTRTAMMIAGVAMSSALMMRSGMPPPETPPRSAAAGCRLLDCYSSDSSAFKAVYLPILSSDGEHGWWDA